MIKQKTKSKIKIKKNTKIVLGNCITFAVQNAKHHISIIIKHVFVLYLGHKEGLNYHLRDAEYVVAKDALRRIESFLTKIRIIEIIDNIEIDHQILLIQKDLIHPNQEKIQEILIISNTLRQYKEYCKVIRLMLLSLELEFQKEQNLIYQVETQIMLINNKFQLLIAKPVLF